MLLKPSMRIKKHTLYHWSIFIRISNHVGCEMGLCNISTHFQCLWRTHHVARPYRPRLWSVNCWPMHKWIKICRWHNTHYSIYGDVTYASMHQIHKQTLWLCLNIQKTIVMVIGNVDDEAKQLTIENNAVESIDSFICLGAQIHTNSEHSIDIRRRILIAKTPWNCLKKYGKAIKFQ